MDKYESGDDFHDRRGDKRGFLVLGLNGRWFACGLDRQGWADPLQGADNLAGNGSSTPEEARVEFLEANQPPEQLP